MQGLHVVAYLILQGGPRPMNTTHLDLEVYLLACVFLFALPALDVHLDAVAFVWVANVGPK